MPRSDSILNTGMNSSTVNKADRMRMAREAKRLLKIDRKTKLTPAAEVVVEELTKERDRTTMEVLDMVDTYKADDPTYRASMQALQLYRESMNALKTRMSNISRVKESSDE